MSNIFYQLAKSFGHIPRNMNFYDFCENRKYFVCVSVCLDIVVSNRLFTWSPTSSVDDIVVRGIHII
jgi:hypothetical protein